MNILYDGLAEVFLTLLKNVETREKVLQYLATTIMKNTRRSAMQVSSKYNTMEGML